MSEWKYQNLPMTMRTVEMGRFSASATMASSAASDLSPWGAIAFSLCLFLFLNQTIWAKHRGINQSEDLKWETFVYGWETWKRRRRNMKDESNGSLTVDWLWWSMVRILWTHVFQISTTFKFQGFFFNFRGFIFWILFCVDQLVDWDTWK